MSAQITITAAEGSLRGKQFVFGDRTMCTVGRSHDCLIHLPHSEPNRAASRHHCVFDINPPYVRVRDLGSRNGTFVNGAGIGRREPGQSPAEAFHTDTPCHDLRDGDEVRVADNVLRVNILVPAVCLVCGRTIPGDRQAGAEEEPDGLLCPHCRKHAEKAQPVLPPQTWTERVLVGGSS